MSANQASVQRRLLRRYLPRCLKAITVVRRISVYQRVAQAQPAKPASYCRRHIRVDNSFVLRVAVAEVGFACSWHAMKTSQVRR